MAVALVNRGSSGTKVTCKAVDVGLLDARKVWWQAGVADFMVELAQHVQPHQTIVLKISGGGERHDG